MYGRGWNMYGDLGAGNDKDVGVQPGDMGDNLPPIQLGRGRVVKSFATGETHTCVLFTDATLACFGRAPAIGRDSGAVFGSGWSPLDMGDNLEPVDLGSNVRVTAVAAGAAHTCVILEGGVLKCFGECGAGRCVSE